MIHIQDTSSILNPLNSPLLPKIFFGCELELWMNLKIRMSTERSRSQKNMYDSIYIKLQKISKTKPYCLGMILSQLQLPPPPKPPFLQDWGKEPYLRTREDVGQCPQSRVLDQWDSRRGWKQTAERKQRRPQIRSRKKPKTSSLEPHRASSS